jgi:NitT/TauT family transport system ATP-binding protein
MADHFMIDLPYPRHLELKTTDRFGEYASRIYHLGIE